jgi:hypothetical protein
MAKQNRLQDWQKAVILRDHATNTAEQIAVRAKTTVHNVYQLCRDNNVSPMKPSAFNKALNAAKPFSKHTPLPSLVAAAIKRPAAIYTNRSPYGIATELHQGKIF